MRTGSGTGTTGLVFLLGDHLGSTSVTYDAATGQSRKQLYKPWGEVRYTSATLQTKYTYTGQYSNVADFGLMFYRSRWYDPALGRWASPDSIVPNPHNPLDWDRFSYVRNNALKYIDPTGHDPACGPDGVLCDGDPLNDSLYYPDSLNLSLLSSDNDPETIDGYDVYILYLDMWKDGSGIWWTMYGENGFSYEDFLNYVFSIEIDIMSTHEGIADYKEGVVRAAHQFCKYLGSCKASTLEGISNFLAIWSGSLRSRISAIKLGAAISTQFRVPEYFATASIHASELVNRLFNPEYWNGWARGRPYNPGNITLYTGQELIIDYANNWTFNHPDDPWVKLYLSGNSVIIPFGCGAWFIKSDQSAWNAFECGQWPLP